MTIINEISTECIIDGVPVKIYQSYNGVRIQLTQIQNGRLRELYDSFEEAKVAAVEKVAQLKKIDRQIIDLLFQRDELMGGGVHGGYLLDELALVGLAKGCYLEELDPQQPDQLKAFTKRSCNGSA